MFFSCVAIVQETGERKNITVNYVCENGGIIANITLLNRYPHEVFQYLQNSSILDVKIK